MPVDWDWERVVFDHVKITVRDSAASVAFYKTVLATLDIPPLWENERGAQFANLVIVGGEEPGGPLTARTSAQRCRTGRPKVGWRASAHPQAWGRAGRSTSSTRHPD